LPVQDEWLDTAAEEKFGRLRWLAPDDAITPSAVEARPPGEPDQARVDAEAAQPHAEGAAAVGQRIGVWWIDDAQFYHGVIRQWDAETGVRAACGSSSSRFSVGKRKAALDSC
jgi:hypothetical protein